MILRVLGCAGAEFPNFRPPAFLIDDELLLDAGTVGSVLTESEQWLLSYICVTHAHLDHIRGIPALADNIIMNNMLHMVTVAGTAPVITSISDHLMNNIIWPDFTKIPTPDSPVITYQEVIPGKEFFLDEYSITAFNVNHSVPAVGYIIRKAGKALLYTGDTGPTEEIWKHAANLSAMIVEVSFPNDMEEMALLTGHLTARLLSYELAKIAELPTRILITHPKPQHYEIIQSELVSLGIPQIELLKDGSVYDL
jgi:ribonuclease BN (tRNA processing enzyme)